MIEIGKKKAIASYFNTIARPDQYFAGGWITIRAKKNEHKIVSEMLAREENFPAIEFWVWAVV